jgi:hypothetical protein
MVLSSVARSRSGDQARSSGCWPRSWVDRSRSVRCDHGPSDRAGTASASGCGGGTARSAGRSTPPPQTVHRSHASAPPAARSTPQHAADAPTANSTQGAGLWVNQVTTDGAVERDMQAPANARLKIGYMRTAESDPAPAAWTADPCVRSTAISEVTEVGPSATAGL